MFKGKSLLRTGEEKPPPPVNKDLQAYLAKYTSGDDGKKKRKKRKPKAVAAGVRIVDEDVSGFGAAPRAPEPDEDDDFVPVIANEEEAERAQRQIATAKAGFYSREEGSGWQAAQPDAQRQRHDSDDDASPPRRQRHDSDDNASPTRRTSAAAQQSRQRHDSDDDDASPPRRHRHDSDDDASPPRRTTASAQRPKQRHDSDDDALPPRRQRHDSDLDASPPRRTAAAPSPAAAPQRRRHDQDDSDASPPRRHAGNDSDASPTRRGAAAASRKRSASADLSPPRKRAAADGDASPPRRPGPKTMTDGTAAGMISGRQLAEELAKKKQADRERLANLDASVSGRHAETVHRDKSGRIVTEEELKAAKEKERKAKEWVTPEWAGGVKQQRDAATRAAELAAQASQPFARTKEALDRDVSVRERVRWGDPMAHLAHKKLAAAEMPPPIPIGKLKKSGFIIPQEVPAHSWLKRNLGPPPNRYNIRPGRHWDGVDRSNGFERELFKTQNAQATAQREARAWGQEDM